MTRRRKARKDRLSFLETLSDGGARRVLRELLRRHPELGEEAEGIVCSLYQEVDHEALGDEIADAILDIDEGRFAGDSGRQHDGSYVGPHEAAAALLDEALAPYLKGMNRLLAAGAEDAAVETCMGIMRGLYLIPEHDCSHFLGFIPDYPLEAAAWTMSELLGEVSDRDVAVETFLAFAEELPGWTELLQRAASE